MGRHLAQLQEAKHHAWALGDMSNVLKAMKQEADLLGLDAPKKVANTDTKGNDVSRDSQRILVLGGSSEDYIAACVAMAEDKPAPTLEVYDAQ